MSRFGRAMSAARRGFGEEWRRPDPAVLRWTYLVAWLWVVGWAIGTVATVATDLAGSAITIDLPINAGWSPLGASGHVDGALANLSDGTVTNLHVTAGDPVAAARWWYAVGHLLVGVGNVFCALAVLALVREVRSSAPFAATLSRMITQVAVVVMVAGIGSEIALDVGAVSVIESVFGSWSGSLRESATIDPGSGTLVGVPQGWGIHGPDLWPIGAGLVLLVLARLVRVGERLQVHADALQRDTEGLV